MHVALFANDAWLDEELSAFKKLVVALIDEQVQVTQVVPQTMPMDDLSAFGQRLQWRESRWSPLNRYQLSRLRQPLEEIGVTLLHALDAGLWKGVAHLARQTGLPVVFSANAGDDLDLLPQVLHGLDPTRIALTGSTQPILHAMRELLGPDPLIQLNPPSAQIDTAPRQPQQHPALGAVVTGNGKLDDAYHSLLHAIGMFARQHPQTQFFFDSHRSDQHQLWQAASELDLLPNLSMVPRRLGHRELLTRADVLIQPQPFGRSRSLLLQAMAHGMPVIAHADPWIDYLIDNRTAWLLDQPSPEDWQQPLGRLIHAPQEAQALGSRARQWVIQHRLAAHQVARLLDLYRRMTGETIRFPT